MRRLELSSGQPLRLSGFGPMKPAPAPQLRWVAVPSHKRGFLPYIPAECALGELLLHPKDSAARRCDSAKCILRAHCSSAARRRYRCSPFFRHNCRC